MVTFVKGDIFSSPSQVITNPVNCVGAMGKGLAKVFAQKFPEMETDYKKKCKNGEVSLGKPYLWESDKVQVLNFPTKDHWRNSSSLEGVKKGLEYLAQNYDEMGIGSIALPALGCGLGDLEWSAVKSLIQDVLDPILDLHVFVYEPEVKGIKSAEPQGKDSKGSRLNEEGLAANSL